MSVPKKEAKVIKQVAASVATQQAKQVKKKVAQEVKRDVVRAVRQTGGPRPNYVKVPQYSTRNMNMSFDRTYQTKPLNSRGMDEMRNPYFESLKDPLNVKNVRIPDSVTTPSAVFSINVKGEFSASPTGSAAVTFGGSAASANSLSSGTTRPVILYQTMMVPTNIITYNPSGDVFGTAVNNWAAGCVSGSNCTDSDLWSAGSSSTDSALTTSAIRFDGWSDATAIVPQTFSRVRLVSASLSVMPIGTEVGSSGQMIGVSLPKFETTQVDGPITTKLIENKPGSTCVPVNKRQAINVNYRPVDYSCWEYGQIPSSDGIANSEFIDDTSHLVFSLGQFAGPGNNNNIRIPIGGFNTDRDMSPYTPGELWVVVTGAQPSQPFKYVFTANYEAIPRQAQSALLTTFVSTSDPIGAAHALNNIAKEPMVTAGNSQITATVAPPLSHNTEVPPPTMLDSLLEGVAKVGRKLAPIAMAMI
jgi:hypothetical protein